MPRVRCPCRQFSDAFRTRLSYHPHCFFIFRVINPYSLLFVSSRLESFVHFIVLDSRKTFYATVNHSSLYATTYIHITCNICQRYDRESLLSISCSVLPHRIRCRRAALRLYLSNFLVISLEQVLLYEYTINYFNVHYHVKCKIDLPR